MRDLILAMLLIWPALGQPSGQYTLRGRVVHLASGEPISNLKLTLADGAGRPAAEPVVSRPDGRFGFEGLREGRYALSAILNGQTILYHELAAGGTLSIPVGPAAGKSDIVFPIAPHPSISGMVRDEVGDPIPHAMVDVFSSGCCDPALAAVSRNQAETDDRGYYRLSEVRPGWYFVCARVLGERLRTTARLSGTLDFAGLPDARVYRMSCFPGEPLASFRLDMGQEKQLDFALVSTPAIHIRGHVNNWAKDLAGLSIWKEDHTRYLSGSVLENGDFDFLTAEPGPYVLQAWRYKTRITGQPEFFATRTIVVEGAGESGVELDFEPAGTIDVTLEENARSPAPQYPVAIRLRDTSPAYYALYQGDQSGGPPWFNPIPPASYWLTTWAAAPFCIESVRMDGADIRHGIVRVTPGAALHMDVSLSDQCATIQGKVAKEGKPAPFSRVVLLLSGTPQSPGEMVEATSNETGDFFIGQLPPGQYLMWAWPLEDPAYTEPANLAEVSAQATAVSIGKGQRVFIQVPQLNGKERQ